MSKRFMKEWNVKKELGVELHKLEAHYFDFLSFILYNRKNRRYR